MNTLFVLRTCMLRTMLFVLINIVAVAGLAEDNGIHVGAPKVYDARALELMMDQLASTLQRASLVDPKALATALGNMQGFNSTDFSQGLNLSGAVGPNAAAVFAGNAASGGGGSATSTSPTVSINIAPTQNAGTAVSAPASGAAATTGPQPPALPALQTAPTYSPNFGPSGADLLSDEANLTYQLFNLRMMLERSLGDRLHGKDARLQAVLGFDIDIEPAAAARDAAALVDVTVKIDCKGLTPCDSSGEISIVALMPEEGSHNAATLSQRASAFGGALASAVFSVGYSAQKRSQTFYLYRDMDTLSVEPPAKNGEAHFGWQFRPVLGRRTVAPGKRHLIVVLGLPASDQRDEKEKAPQLTATVSTSWKRYDNKLQATSDRRFLVHTLPEPSKPAAFSFEVPETAAIQEHLGPKITSVTWLPTDASSGVAIVSGKNLFPGTAVRFGSKTYSGGDGLVIKSDQELEVAVPSATVAMGGVLSGRYGDALALIREKRPAGGFFIDPIRISPIGDFLDSVDLTLITRPTSVSEHPDFPSIAELNPPIVLLNGVALTIQPAIGSGGRDSDNNPLKDRIHLYFSAPASTFSKSAIITVTFPFAGPEWSESVPYYDTTLRVIRLTGPSQSALLISATNEAAALCDGWTLMLDGGTSYGSDSKQLRCVDHTLQFSIDSATLNSHKRLALTKPGRAPLTADIPKSDAPPPQPTVSNQVSVPQYAIRAVTFKGQNLDSVTKVLFDKTALEIAEKKVDHITINLTKEVTDKPRPTVELQLLSDGNDPVIAVLTVTPTPEPKGK